MLRPHWMKKLQNKFMIVSCQSDSRGFIIAWKLVWKLWREGRKTRSWIFISSVIFHSSFLACLKEKVDWNLSTLVLKFLRSLCCQEWPSVFFDPYPFFSGSCCSVWPTQVWKISAFEETSHLGRIEWPKIVHQICISLWLPSNVDDMEDKCPNDDENCSSTSLVSFDFGNTDKLVH